MLLKFAHTTDLDKFCSSKNNYLIMGNTIDMLISDWYLCSETLCM